MGVTGKQVGAAVELRQDASEKPNAIVELEAQQVEGFVQVRTKSRFFFWLPRLVHYSVLAAPIVPLGLLYKHGGVVPALTCALGALYRVYRVILNQSVDSCTEFTRRTLRGSRGVKKCVCVIGAGPSGLPTTKELLDEGHDVVTFEAESEIGGVFQNKFWAGGQLTSSPYVTAYSDFEPPRSSEGQEHWLHYYKEEYVQYMRDYAAHFGLGLALQMGKKVEKIEHRRCKESGVCKFFCNVRHVESGLTEEYGPFDHLAVCTGRSDIPNVDTNIPGFHSFTGKVMHTMDFSSAPSVDDAFKDVAGKRVVTVGLGESMADILGLMCDDMSIPPSKLVASVRSGAWVIPRINPLTGLNNDFDTTRIRYSLPRVVHNATVIVCSYLSYWFPRRPNAEAEVNFKLFQGIRHFAPCHTFATKSARFVKAAAAGKLHLKEGIAKIDKKAVHFQDGSVVEDVDVILFGSGYKPPKFSFFSEDTFKESDYKPSCPCASEKFLRIFDAGLGDLIGYIGYARPLIGTIPTISEMQARLFAQVVSGNRRLPSEAKMHQEAMADRTKQERAFKKYNNCSWHGLVDWIPYMDSLAEEIGCRPKRSWLLTRPSLGFKLVAGPMSTFHYRLTGPGAKPQMAEDVIRRIPFSGRGVDTLFFLALHFTESLFNWPFLIAYDFGYYPFGRAASFVSALANGQ
mmetsp:Transcript_54451/g.129766  ORF Transcript_54451/g.129766 Transcript_54451/m.129766 type:complete len:683 (-) Transcript_54451:257-2305(-)